MSSWQRKVARNSTGRTFGLLAQMTCAACSRAMEVTFEELKRAKGGQAPRCRQCVEEGRPATATRGEYTIAVMDCRICHLPRVQLPPAEALELKAAGRLPLCGFCFVDVEGPRLAAEAVENGEVEIAQRFRDEIERARVRNAAAATDPLALELHMQTLAAVAQSYVRKTSPGEA